MLIDTTVAIALSQIPPPAFPVNQWTPGTVARTMEELTGSASSATAAGSMRLSLWQATLSALSDGGNLWTGLGGNGFARLQVVQGVQISARPQIHPHNAIVQLICDWGIVGLLLSFTFVSKTIVLPAIRAGRACDATALAGIAYLSITGMFDATLFHLEHLVYLMLGLGLLLSSRPHPNTTTAPLKGYLIICLLCGLVTAHLLSLDYRIGLGWYFRTE